MEASSVRQHAVLVSSPGMGHLNSFLGLARRLSSTHSFKVTVLFVTINGATHAPVTNEQYPDLNLLNVPAAEVSGIVDPGTHMVTKICVHMRETAPSVRAAISGLPRPTLVVLDMFATGPEYLAIARELALPSFVFVGSAWNLALLAYYPVLDKQVQGDFVNPFDIPGCRRVRLDDLMDPIHQRREPYQDLVRIGTQIHLFDGVLVMTWQDLEGSTLAALREGTILRVPVYDIGPIVAEPDTTPGGGGGAGDGETLLMEWLDKQPDESVIYISFGCGGTLSRAQMTEIAGGLEMSKKTRFVWVVRPPMDGDASGTYMGLKAAAGVVDSVDNYLPHGFREKTRDVGRVVPLWAPQSKVLSHPSVGAFWTHCGWNSVNESLKNGVPMIAWPLFAEQGMNATMLVEELKVAIRTRELPGIRKVVRREEIAEMVRVLLEGEEGQHLRMRAKELQRSGAQALTPNGSSYNRLSALVQTLKMCKLEHHLPG